MKIQMQMIFFPLIWTFYFLNKGQKCKRLLCNMNFLVISQETNKIKLKGKTFSLFIVQNHLTLDIGA